MCQSKTLASNKYNNVNPLNNEESNRNKYLMLVFTDKSK